MSPGQREQHALLEPPSAQYSGAVVQRAFLVWTLLGHSHRFRDVADYYRRLERLEESFTPERRKESRDYEYSLLTAQPPTSECLLEHFPRLYSTNKIQYRYPDVTNKDSAFEIQGFRETEERNGATSKEVLEASQMIRTYCKAHQLNIREFLAEFQNYARKHDVNLTVSNVAFYIKHKYVQKDRQLAATYRGYDLHYMNSPPNDKYRRDAELNGNGCVQNYVQSPIVENGMYLNRKKNTVSELPMAIKQAELFYNNAKMAEIPEDSEKNQINNDSVTTVTSECGIDDVLNKIVDLNHVYGKEINNDKIACGKKSPITAEIIPTNKSTIKLDHNRLINSKTAKKYDEERNCDVVFAKKNKNQIISNAVPVKKPSYCMKLKVKSKRSKSQAKRSKTNQPSGFSTNEDSFKSCELNLIDLDSSGERAYNVFNYFDEINNRRCSTSSR